MRGAESGLLIARYDGDFAGDLDVTYTDLMRARSGELEWSAVADRIESLFERKMALELEYRDYPDIGWTASQLAQLMIPAYGTAYAVSAKMDEKGSPIVDEDGKRVYEHSRISTSRLFSVSYDAEHNSLRIANDRDDVFKRDGLSLEILSER